MEQKQKTTQKNFKDKTNAKKKSFFFSHLKSMKKTDFKRKKQFKLI